MHIDEIKLVNYKGFRDSGPIPIGRKFTVIIGQNNSGKTSMLEAFDTRRFRNLPFQRVRALEERFDPVLSPASSISFKFNFSGEELKWSILASRRSVNMVAPAPPEHNLLNELVHHFFTNQNISIAAEYTPNGWSTSSPPAAPLGIKSEVTVTVTGTDDFKDIRIINANVGSDENIVSSLVGPYVQDAVYVFRAERLNVSQCDISPNETLDPDAGNLASVLLQLNANRTKRDIFTTYIRDVFPTIFDITSRPISSNRSQIEVTNKDHATIRPGVTIPLAECGTGISQVIAILYVVVTAQSPRVIVFDEPNTFLHPGAIRKLVAILKDFPHQHIITTHSPEIIRITEPDMLHLTQWNGRECVIKTLDGRTAKDIRNILDEVGARLSDVFGAENILWVEGKTEEICFPLLLACGGHSLPSGTLVVAMVATGDFEGRRRLLAWEVYERLSTGNVLIPPALAFSFDREGRTVSAIEDMLRHSSGRAHFLRRLTYENYLVDEDAIRHVLIAHGGSTSDVTVMDWINQHGADPKYLAADETVWSPGWLSNVHAPKLLSDLFDALSESRVEYRKTVHSVELTKWLIDHKRSALSDLIKYLENIVGQ